MYQMGLFEEELSYSCKDVYVRKCKQVGILPICQRFHMNDLILFHKIINQLQFLSIYRYLVASLVYVLVILIDLVLYQVFFPEEVVQIP